MTSFTCLSLSPIELAHPGLAIATARSGGVGILDREFCRDRNFLECAIKNLDQLLELVSDQDQVGLRLRVDQIAASYSLFERLGERPHWLILSGWNFPSLQKALSLLPVASSRRLLLEVIDITQIQDIDDDSREIDGLVARGHESGGWVSEDSAFILTQKLLGRQPLPVYVQGGIGLHTAAACRAAGAAGVILDDQLWLMPESPFPKEWQRHLSNLTGQEAIVIGERVERGCRVLSRPGFGAISQLQALAERIELEDNLTVSTEQHWWQQAQSLLGWAEPGTLAWPIGQAVGLAAHFRDSYQTTGRLIQALLKTSLEHILLAQSLHPLEAHSPLAVSHKTQYSIVQGPMTRVSDTAEFAHAVAQSGGLPLLALALMRGPQVRDLLFKTKQLLGDRAWGIGILGFVSQALREEQIEQVKLVLPPFALIAGGRPDQAAKLEAMGIATYIHVPTPGLLQIFLEQGGRRFVFEGRECGGHVGPLSSFVLWETMIETLLKDVPSGAESDIHILFAGGIHDARSAAMVAAMAAPLVERGMRIGVLMGTAYLFTQEAVSCGAIVEEFQAQALHCTRTINLETGPGHASRCVVTPFAQEFYKTRRQMMAAKCSPEDIKNTLEDLTLGRLRIASKGLMRDASGQITKVDTDQQITDGMYMIGQVASMPHQVCTLQTLHEDVSQKSSELLSLAAQLELLETQQSQPKATPSDIAIIGISTLLPQAQTPEIFWKNILQKVDAITEIPAHRWDWRLYYDQDRQARDKVYSKWGGFLEDVPFDPLRFGIPPKSLKSIEPAQLLTLEAVRRALDDAGYSDGTFDRENTSVVLGAGGGIGDLGGQYAARAEVLRVVDAPSPEVWQRLPEWTEESFPGVLLNVLAGRVANRFDLGGSNFTVDAACASSLAAVDLAVKELESGRCNVAIAGGVDTGQSPFAYLCFSKTQALSPRGRSHTFDQSADGIVISEGIAIVVLKRLADAQRDGDRIYAVIKAVAGSSDGKALGMTAPRPVGQMRALERAYTKAGFSPSTLGLYEAHGTGTVAGDKAELETTLRTLEAEKAASQSCVIGSIKTMIGHTKSSAGVAGLIKVALSLHHKVLPPHLNVTTPLDPIVDPQSPVYLLKEAQPWLTQPHQPRRGAVSAFGFGGTNFHAVLEEYRGEFQPSAPGAADWAWELFVLRAKHRHDLVKEVQFLLEALKAGASPRLQDLAYSYAKKAQATLDKTVVLSIVTESLQQLQGALELVQTHIESPTPTPLPPHIQIAWNVPTENPPVAFLFPGQGAQYPDMVREAALYFSEMRESLEQSDRQLQHCFPKRLSQYIYPPSAYSEAAQKHNQKLLMDTQIAQPAIGAVEAGFMDLAVRLDLKPAMVCGHSYGEYAALHCAGVFSREDFLSLSATRGRVMAEACAASVGAMAAVQATREELLTHLKNLEGVVIANQNAPRQCVISGDKRLVGQVVESLNGAGITARMLPVSGAFHSALVASAQTALATPLANVAMQSPKIPVYANSTALPYDLAVASIRSQLSKQLLSPVQFMSQINAMYEAGARVFVELGPKNILTNLVGQILADKEHTAVSLDGQGGGLRGLLMALATLVGCGVDWQLTALFEGRNVRQLDLSRLVELTRKPELTPTTWLVNGGSARPMSEAVGYTGKIPPLTQETAAFAHKVKKETAPLTVENTHKPLQSPTSSAPTLSQETVTSTPNPRVIPTHPPMARPVLPPVSTSSSGMNSQPIIPPASTPSTSPVAPAMSGEIALAAYQAYQQTMQQFLAVQEQVMKQFLGATQGGQSVSLPRTIAPTPTAQPSLRMAQPVPPSPAIAPAPVPAPSAPQNGSHSNGNGSQIAPANTPVVVSSPQPAPVSEMPVVPITPTAVTPNLPVQLNRDSLTQTLLQLVSDRTGYPTDMLGLDQDMEAELGIDSIKRVEIFGALQKTLPEPIAASLRDQMESLTRIKTLNKVVEALLQNEAQTFLEEEKSLGKSLP